MPSFEAVMAWDPGFVVQAVVALVVGLAVHKLLIPVYRKAKRAISAVVTGPQTEEFMQAFAAQYHRGPNGPLGVLATLCWTLAFVILLWTLLMGFVMIIILRPPESIIATVSLMALCVPLFHGIIFMLRGAECAFLIIQQGIRADAEKKPGLDSRDEE